MDHSSRPTTSSTLVNGSEGNGDSTAESLYTHALRMYEQQMNATLGNFSSNPSAAAASMLGYNPFLMASPFGAIAGFPGLGGLAGVNPSDYQAAAAMTAGFPSVAALYGSPMGFPGMPFSASDYATAMAAYSLSTSMPLTTTSSHFGIRTAADRDSHHSSNAINSLRSGQNSDSISNIHQSPSPRTASRSSVQSSNSLSKSQNYVTNRKSSSQKDAKTANSSQSSLLQNLSAEEVDVNMHFKKSLGTLCDQTPSNGSSAQVTSSVGCLDLSLKNCIDKPKIAETVRTSDSKVSHLNNQTRESVIQAINPANHKTSRSEILNTSSHSPRPSNTETVPKEKAVNNYEALPNLKRLSEQLKTEKPASNQENVANSNSSKQRHIVSLLRHNHTQSSSDVKTKIRKGKQNLLSLKTESASLNHQANKYSTDDKQVIKDELERVIKTQPSDIKLQKKTNQESHKTLAKQSTTEVSKPKRRRKNQDAPRTGVEATPIVVETGPPKETKPKRIYVRTKLAKEKLVDMDKLKVPFEYGWRRETRLRGISKTGRIIGEVFYYTPSDKRMRSFNEVKRYLDTIKPSDSTTCNGGIPPDQSETKEDRKEENMDVTESLTSDATCNSKVGTSQSDELEVIENSQSSTDKVQSAAESKADCNETAAAKSVNNRPPEWECLKKDHFSFNSKVKLGDFLEQKPGEKYVLLSDQERDQRIQTANDKRNKQIDKMNKIKAKKLSSKENSHKLDQGKMQEIKQYEKAQKTLLKKLKKQMDKSKNKSQNEKTSKTVTLQMRKKALQEAKNKDKLQKQQRCQILLEERERRLKELRQRKAEQRIEKARMKERQKQTLLNSKLIEARRKEEERRRLQMEKILVKERKQELKKREMELARELKQPADGLRLPNVKNLPSLNRIPGMKLPACVFANVLQVHQFVTNFYECLEFKQSIPSLNTFQQALLNDNTSSISTVNRILCHLLNFALKDPGVPNPLKFKNELGQKLNGKTVDEFNFSEILRQFMMVRDKYISQLSKELENKPFSCLSMQLRSQAMVWLCDELNTSQTIMDEIDTNMENVSALRRDKWEIEGKIRELKSNTEAKQLTKVKDNEHNSDQSENEEEVTSSENVNKGEGAPTDQDGKSQSVDEKKLDKLNKQYSKVCQDVVTGCSTVRTLPYGMDRYRRYYWCLPSFKGIFVESQECSLSDLTSGPSDLNLELATPSSEFSENANSDVAKEEATPTDAMDTSQVKSEPDLVSEVVGASTPAIDADKVKKAESTDHNIPKLEQKSVNDVISHRNNETAISASTSTHSIASLLSSTIDNIFGANDQPDGSSMNQSVKSSQHSTNIIHNSLTDSPTQASHSQGISDDIWFELNRKLPCAKLPTCSSALVANSLAFMSCVIGSDEQKELEALEAMAAKNALLDKPRPLPTAVQKGWWIINDYEQVKALTSSFHQRAIREKHLNRQLNKHTNHLQNSCSEKSTDTELQFDCDERDGHITSNPYNAPVVDESQIWYENQCRVAELQILDKVEDLEERVYQASMYTKNWAEKKKNDATDLVLVITPSEQIKDGEKRIIDLVKEKLLLLETGIERRYLKPPFIKSAELNIEDIVSGPIENGGRTSDSEDEVGKETSNNEEICSKGLLQWQRAVRGAVNLSQLYLNLQQLESCIAWEKSVMKVLCQVCRSDDNEDQLLLCDGCDKGYHTYCFKPKMTCIPDGNWYCWECKSKATSVPHCIRCGKSTGKMAQCHKCPQAIHIDCCTPPMLRVPRKHTCGHCLRLSKQKSSRGRRSCQNRKKMADCSSSDEDGTASDTRETDEEKDECSTEAELAACKEILADLERLKDARPFLEPVDTKAFPQYRKYIKQPMDLGTVSEKFTQNKYKSKAEFYDDMILIFDNCLLFNEDNSDVGKSGKLMRRQFLKRWKRLESVSGD